MDTKKLRQKILDLAIRGKLVPQDPNDEPASILLERIRAEKERLIAEGKIKRPKKSKTTSSESHYQNLEPPFEILASWEWVIINDIGEIVTGNTPSKEVNEFYGGNVPFYKPTDLSQGINTQSASDTLTQLGFEQSRQLPINSILITCIGATLGKIGLIKKAGSCNQQINAIIPNNSVVPEYVFYVCSSSYFQNCIKENASSTTLPILNKRSFSSLVFPLPPISEQRAIIASIKDYLGILNNVGIYKIELKSAILACKSKILELAMQGKLVPQDPADESAAEMLKRINPNARIITDNPHSWNIPNRWCLCELRDLCTFLSRGKSPKYSDVPNQYPVFAQKCNLKDGGISLNQARFLDESTLPKWPNKYKLKDQDILVNSTGTGTVGRTRLFLNKYLKDFPFVLPDSHVSVVRTFDEIDSKFIYYNLISREGQTYFNDNLSGSTNQKELYIETIGNNLIFLPPKKEQEWIVARIEELYHCIDKIEASLQSE